MGPSGQGTVRVWSQLDDLAQMHLRGGNFIWIYEGRDPNGYLDHPKEGLSVVCVKYESN